MVSQIERQQKWIDAFYATINYQNNSQIIFFQNLFEDLFLKHHFDK
jgi:hypothetical protein